MSKIIKIGILSIIAVSLTCCQKQGAVVRNTNIVGISLDAVQETKATATDQEQECISILDINDNLCLTVKVSDNPVNIGQATKGTNTTTSSFTTLYAEDGFKVYAEKHRDPSEVLFNNATFKFDGTIWSPETSTVWPEYATDFCAWAPGDVAVLSPESKSFSYTVETTNEDQTDLLVANAYSAAGFSGSLPMTFTHALCEVKFATNEETPAGSLSSLKISGVKLSGTYDFATREWTIPDSSENGTITLDLSSSPLAVSEGTEEWTALTSESQTFFVIPQDCNSDTKLEISFKSTTDDGPQTYELNLPEDFVFEKGTVVTFAVGPKAEYVFNLVDEIDAEQTFTNTTASSTVTIALTSKLEHISGESDDAEWIIKSVKVGDSDAVTVNDTHFEGIGGLNVSQTDNSTLSITATPRDSYSPGSHAYWVNDTNRTDNLDWSPDDWSASTSGSPIDLSKFDLYNDAQDTQAMTTANCYIIRHAGTYKIPLVYGNGIVNGAFNEQSYYPNCKGDLAVADTVGRLVRFVNHLGYGITSPFIEYNTTDGNVKSSSNEYLAAASGENGYEIVWQDYAAIITIDGISKESVTVKNADGVDETFNVSYLTFTIPQNKIRQNNAIIAVKDGSGNTMWSWHIWTTNNPMLLSNPIPVFNHSNVEYDFFPLYNLGYVDGEHYPAMKSVKITLAQKITDAMIEISVNQSAGFSLTRGCYYEWGRKDPFPGIESLAQGNIPDASGGANLEDVILNPGTYYVGKSKYILSWFIKPYKNLWSGKFNSCGQYDQNDQMIKTIYDPSPSGYKVPASNAFTGCTLDGNNCNSSKKDNWNIDWSKDLSNGYYFYTKPKDGDTIFFPLTERKGATGSFFYSYYWTAIPHNYQEDVGCASGYYFLFSQYRPKSGGTIEPRNNGANSSTGSAVRPVKE